MPRQDNGLVVDATIELAEAAPLYAEYGNAQLGWLRTATDAATSVHHLPLIRLRADTAYSVRAFALDAAGCPIAGGAGEFTSGGLPPLFSKLVIEANGRPSVPLVMMDLRVDPGDLRWLVAFDQDWKPVWYYQLPRTVLRAAVGRGVNGVIRLANGNFLYLARNFGLEELTPDARVARRIHTEDTGIHHDLVQLPDGRIMFLGAEEKTIDDTPNGGPPDFRVRGDVLYILDLEKDYEQPFWSVFDVADPLKRNLRYEYRTEDGAQEWTHGNSIALGQHGNVILSFRHLDQIMSLSPDLQTVEWRLGGANSDFKFADPSDRPYGQHAVTELPNGHLLMFDNGNFRPEGDFSRALELELDFTTMTARKVWEYRHQPDMYSPSQSNAVRLENGETMVNFGFVENPDDPTVLVSARADGTAAWEMALHLEGQRATRYRVYPLTAMAGEMPVEPTALGLGPGATLP